MSGGEELSPASKAKAEAAWRNAAENAIAAAEWIADLGVAKETVNRVLEPFLRIRTLVTATEWDNFFELRFDEAHVQPEMFDLANAMRAAMDASEPVERRYHLPYVDDPTIVFPEAGVPSSDDMMISAARCARVSYLTHDGMTPQREADLLLATSLMKNHHVSPFEHVATALNDRTKARFNLVGWASCRYTLEKGGV